MHSFSILKNRDPFSFPLSWALIVWIIPGYFMLSLSLWFKNLRWEKQSSICYWMLNCSKSEQINKLMILFQILRLYIHYCEIYRKYLVCQLHWKRHHHLTQLLLLLMLWENRRAQALQDLTKQIVFELSEISSTSPSSYVSITLYITAVPSFLQVHIV